MLRNNIKNAIQIYYRNTERKSNNPCNLEKIVKDAYRRKLITYDEMNKICILKK